MAVAYVIHSEEDRPFVEKRLIRPLPALGFDRWASRTLTLSATGSRAQQQSAMKSAAVILAVVPASASVNEPFRQEVEAALECFVPIVPVYLGSRNSTPRDAVLSKLEK